MALKWYVVHAYSNFENKVRKGSLEDRIKLKGLEAQVRQDHGAHRGSGGNERGAEAPQRTEVFPRLCAGPDGARRRDLAPGEGSVRRYWDLSAVPATDLRPSATRKLISFSTGLRRAPTSRGRRCCSSPVRSYASSMDRSTTSVEWLKTSTTTRTSCASPSRFWAVRRRWSWTSARSKRAESDS